jgi:hypothetical protein
MLTATKTTHSRNPWRLAWHGRLLEDVSFRTQREALTACRDLLTIADFALPGPEAWSADVQGQVAGYLRALPCVQELEQVRTRMRAPR